MADCGLWERKRSGAAKTWVTLVVRDIVLRTRLVLTEVRNAASGVPHRSAHQRNQPFPRTQFVAH